MEFSDKNIVNYVKGDYESALEVMKNMYYRDIVPENVKERIKGLCEEYKERQRLKGNIDES
jgi:translation initiation factor RLI1